MKKSALILALIFLAGCASNTTGTDSKEESSVSSEKETASSSDTVTFGSYQDENIEWYVLTQEDGKSLLLSVHAIDTKPFNDSPSTWDNSSLRTWLNDEFYQNAFTADEQKEIQLTHLHNGDELGYGTATGQDTDDHVFLLSASEAEKYLSDKETTTSPTQYALSQGAYTNDKGDCAWWLRSPGMDDDGPAYYSSQGEVGTRAHKGSETIIGVRPAIWVSSDALKK